MPAIKEINALPTARPIVYNENDINAWSSETLSTTAIMVMLINNKKIGLYAKEDNNVEANPFNRLNTIMKTSLSFFLNCIPNIELKKKRISRAPKNDEAKLIIIS